MKFLATDNLTVRAMLEGHDEQSISPGPYLVTTAMSVYDAEEVDEKFGIDHGISGQYCLVVSQSDTFSKVLIPVDEDDGHSAGEAMHTLRALNHYDKLVQALKDIRAISQKINQRLKDSEEEEVATCFDFDELDSEVQHIVNKTLKEIENESDIA